MENAVKEGIVTPEEIEQSYTDKNVRDEIKKKVIGNNYVNNAINNGNYDTIVNGISKDLNATNTLNQYQSEISKRLSNNPEYQELFKQDLEDGDHHIRRLRQIYRLICQCRAPDFRQRRFGRNPQGSD